MAEEWRPVVGFEQCYEVSDRGRVRSRDRVSSTRNRWGEMARLFPGKMLAPTLASTGYMQVMLSHGGARFQRHVHSLVAAAFIGPRQPGLCVCHRDDDKTNNAPSNLYYGTHNDNRRDAERNGRAAYGERCGSARLTDADIAQMISWAGSITHKEIGEMFGMSRQYVGKILRGGQWAHIERPAAGVRRCAPGRHHRRALGM